jgi:hypothetical protein
LILVLSSMSSPCDAKALVDFYSSLHGCLLPHDVSIVPLAVAASDRIVKIESHAETIMSCGSTKNRVSVSTTKGLLFLTGANLFQFGDDSSNANKASSHHYGKDDVHERCSPGTTGHQDTPYVWLKTLDPVRSLLKPESLRFADSWVKEDAGDLDDPITSTITFTATKDEFHKMVALERSREASLRSADGMNVIALQLFVPLHSRSQMRVASIYSLHGLRSR